jgi:hypothetical protein
MIKKHERYQAYLVRLWQVSGGERPAWRASIEDPHTGERRGFPNIASLFAFVNEQIGNAADPDREKPSREP